MQVFEAINIIAQIGENDYMEMRKEKVKNLQKYRFFTNPIILKHLFIYSSFQRYFLL